jgi:hypothetical protein
MLLLKPLMDIRLFRHRCQVGAVKLNPARTSIGLEGSNEDVIAICSKHGFQFFLGIGTVIREWALAHQGHEQEGIAQILHGLDIY